MENSKTICVMGLGYIGLPTASMFATHGYHVHGVDVNPHVVSSLEKGIVHIEEPGLSTIVKAAIGSKNLSIHGKPNAADIFIIAVPTPYIKGQREIPIADMSFVQKALEQILPLLREGNLVVLESTSPPGTTVELIIPALQKAGFKPGENIGVAYCPERVIPGQALKELIGNDRVVGAITPEWGEKVRTLYKSFVSGEIFLTTPTVAEMVKIAENTYRDINIAYANEIALVCEKLNISVWDVIQIANRHPRVNIHKPGPGVGGHCISVDPWFLVEKFPKETNVVHLARKTNDAMPHHVIQKIDLFLAGKRKSKIAVLGLSYKGNVDDIRESPAIEIVHLLQKSGRYELAIWDPHVKSKEFQIEGIEETFRNADLAVVLTAHDEFKFLDPDGIGALMRTRVVYDTHHILNAERWKKAGFKVHTLGMPNSN